MRAGGRSITKTLAITGATGFVGQRLIKLLRQHTQPYNVRLLVRDVAKAHEMGLDAKTIEFVKGNLADMNALDALCSNADIVVHLAGAIAARNDDEFLTINRDGVASLCNAARQNGVSKFLLISSLAAREPELSGYCASKAAGEKVVRDLDGKDMEWVIIRPPAVYGPGDKATLPLLKALRQRFAVLPSCQGSRFSMIYVDDLAAAILALLEDVQFNGQILEVDDGNAKGYSWEQLAEISANSEGKSVKPLFLPQFVLNFVAKVLIGLAKLQGTVPILSPGKVKELYHHDWCCRNRVMQESGFWEAQTEFAAGYDETVSWYRKHGWL